MRIPGQRHSSHCSTAPASSQRLLPDPQRPPKLPSWGQPPSTRASALLDSLTTRSFPSAVAVGAAQGLHTHRLHPRPPTPLPPSLAHSTHRRSHLGARLPSYPEFTRFEAERQQPLAAQRLGLRVSGPLWGAMIYYTAVPASGASTAGLPGPRPRPPMPQTQTPGPRFLLSLNQAR